MKKIKVVQIGIGHDHARLILNSILRQNEVFEFMGLAVPESEKTDFADRIAMYTNLEGFKFLSVEEALHVPGLDAAIIETEEENLVKFALCAAEKGIHVHMDKPGGLEFASFKKLADILKEKKLVFSLGYMYRYNPVINEAFQKVQNGDIGEVYAVEAHMSGEHPPEKRQWLERFPGGMMFYLGCHLIDLIYRLQGEPSEVIPMNMSTGIDGVSAEDYGMVIFKYPNGISFAKACIAEPGGFIRRQLVICGSRGTIEIKPLEINILDKNIGKIPGDQWTDVREAYSGGGWNDAGITKRSEVYNRYDVMLQDFAKFVTGEKTNPYSYDYEVNLFNLILRVCGRDGEE